MSADMTICSGEVMALTSAVSPPQSQPSRPSHPKFIHSNISTVSNIYI